LKALRSLGVDTDDLGAPTDTEFRNLRGKVRVHVKLDAEVKRAYGGGFIGLLRPELYERMLAAIPEGMLQFGQRVDRIEQDDRAVTLHFADGSSAEHDLLVGADGIDSLVRRTLWGDAPKREHRLHVFGGFTLTDVPGTQQNMSVLTHSATVQGSWTSIRHKGRDGHQWWMLAATDPDAPAPADLRAAAAAFAAGFPAPLPGLIEATDPANVQRWVLRDRPRLKQWSKGRATLVGDAAHPTSPYAAYGAGMSIEDGYFLGKVLRGVDLTDLAAVRAALQAYEDPRKPHTARQVQQACMLGKVFHHTPALLRPLRDLVFDHTPFLQMVAGDTNPKEINKQLALIED
jgi:2-polyprenyl-6-methoxyphenol hydroxylase-like FAD-dependent oxidoreductase